MIGRYAILLLGVFAGSMSVILIRSSHAPPFVLAAMRLVLAVLLLAPVFWRDWRRNRAAFTRDHVRRTLLPAAVLAAHFISWTYGARMTAAAPATLIVNLVPVATPFFLHALIGEQINRREILGTVLALGGIVVLTARDALTGGDFRANLVCFGSMLLFAWYLALGRRNRDFPTLWLYVVPVYAFAAVFCLLAALPQLGALADPAMAGSPREWLLLLGMACIPTIIGHSLLNASMRHLRGQIVSLCNVGQFVFAGVTAFFLFHESPPASFYAASLLVVTGIALVVFSAPTAPPRLR
jgi:drug/metabolite transporter (DMT)-like permease